MFTHLAQNIINCPFQWFASNRILFQWIEYVSQNAILKRRTMNILRQKWTSLSCSWPAFTHLGNQLSWVLLTRQRQRKWDNFQTFIRVIVPSGLLFHPTMFFYAPLYRAQINPKRIRWNGDHSAARRLFSLPSSNIPCYDQSIGHEMRLSQWLSCSLLKSIEIVLINDKLVVKLRSQHSRRNFRDPAAGQSLLWGNRLWSIYKPYSLAVVRFLTVWHEASHI
jgi:hypothetical protein